MMTEAIKLLAVDLTLFDGAAASAASGGSNAASRDGGDADGAPVAGGMEGQANNTAQKQSDPPRDLAAEYNGLIEGEYRDQHTAEMNKVIARRFREMGDLQDRLSAVSPLLDVLKQKYGTDDVKSLTQALENEDALWELEAERAGMTVQQHREFRKLQAQSEQLQRQQRQMFADQEARRQHDAWTQQASVVRQSYPRFDLHTEMMSPDFRGMLRAGVSMQAAYEAAHIDDIKQGVASQAEQRVVNNVRSRGTRPAENGASGPSGVAGKVDIDSLSKKEFDELTRRVLAGETIVL